MQRAHPRFPIAFALGGLLVAALACAPRAGPPEARDGDDGGPPSWLPRLPDLPITLDAGEEVWATVPVVGLEGARPAVYTLVGVDHRRARVRDELGLVWGGVRGALVHSASTLGEGPLEVGRAVLACRLGDGRIVGRLSAVERGRLELAYDHAGTTVRRPIEAAVPLERGGEGLVLRWVAYPAPEGGRRLKGLVIAESPAEAWVSEDDGFVRVVPRGELEVLDAGIAARHEVGAAVRAYRWDTGFRPGRVVEVLEPGLRYAVELEGGGVERFFFADLVAGG